MLLCCCIHSTFSNCTDFRNLHHQQSFFWCNKWGEKWDQNIKAFFRILFFDKFNEVETTKGIHVLHKTSSSPIAWYLLSSDVPIHDYTKDEGWLWSYLPYELPAYNWKTNQHQRVLNKLENILRTRQRNIHLLSYMRRYQTRAIWPVQSSRAARQSDQAEHCWLGSLELSCPCRTFGQYWLDLTWAHLRQSSRVYMYVHTIPGWHRIHADAMLCPFSSEALA